MRERNSENVESRKVKRFREEFEEGERNREIEARKPKSHKEAALQKELGELVMEVMGREFEKAQADYETRRDSK